MATAPQVEVDWSPPWLAPYREPGQAVARDLARGLHVAEALNHQLDRSPIPLTNGVLRFTAPDTTAPGEAYESFIARTAQVPTRDNLHDLFNGLVWLAFPRIKRRLNELHARQIALDGVLPQRGPVRDRLTVFDENGALWRAPPLLVEALRRRDWHALFVTHRVAWQQGQLTLIGHALLEKLTAPRKPIAAHVWVVPESEDIHDWTVVSLHVENQPAALEAPLPLPILGIPGWWPANENEGFYDDAEVFRPLRG